MAVMLQSDVKINEELYRTNLINEIVRSAALFNEATRGGITLNTGAITGLRDRTSRWKETVDLVVRQDTDSIASVDSKKLVDEDIYDTVINHRIGPAEATLLAVDEVGHTPDSIALLLSSMISKQLMDRLKKVALMSLVAIIKKDSSKFEVTKAKYIPTDVFKLEKQFGDQGIENIACLLMSSGSLLNGRQQAYTDKVAAIQSLGQGIILSNGIPIVTSDSASLKITDANPDVASNQAGSWVLAITRGAVNMTLDDSLGLKIQDQLGLAQLTVKMQGQNKARLGCKGNNFNKAVKNPTDSELMTAANWTDRDTDPRNGVGFGLQVLA